LDDSTPPSDLTPPAKKPRAPRKRSAAPVEPLTPVESVAAATEDAPLPPPELVPVPGETGVVPPRKRRTTRKAVAAPPVDDAPAPLTDAVPAPEPPASLEPMAAAPVNVATDVPVAGPAAPPKRRRAARKAVAAAPPPLSVPGPLGPMAEDFDPHDPAQLIAAFRARYPFPLDAFQEEAIGYLAANESVLVAAPTGTGKTVVAEFGVFRAHARGWRVIYTTPIKALSNQKFRDLREQYGDAVGLLTGDIVENREGSILIMTTEVLRNMLLQTPSELWGVGCIVFDEIHYLADKERGTTWEESIIMCPPDVQLACLSATVSNAGEIAEWISRTHRPVHLVSHTQRAVPLSYYYYLDGELNLTINAAGVQVANFAGVGGEVRRRVRGSAWSSAGDEDDGPPRERPEPTAREIVESLERRNMLPAIFFLFSRRDCESAAEVCAMMRFRAAHEPATRQRIEAVIATYMARLAPEDRTLEQVQSITYLARRGLGFHHAGLLPILKQLVEELFSAGLMRVVFATDTLALGINMPARSVVIGRMSKWDGVQRRPLLPNEFQQMAGRAGRRGIDEQGHVVIPYSPWVSFEDALAIATGPLLPVESAFTVRYNTILNLWDPPDGDRVLDVMRHSLLQFQQSRRLLELEDTVAEWDQAVAAVPEGCLIGLPAGEELLSEYEALGRAAQTGRERLRKLSGARERLAAQRTALPWTRPDRETLRRLLRVFPPGGVVHIENRGWAVYLGPRPGGVHLFWLGDHVIGLTGYSAIDYVPPQRPQVTLPAELADLAEGEIAAAPGEHIPVSHEARAWMAEQLAGIDLPDLEQWILTHQQTQGAEIEEQLQQFDTQVAEAEEYVRRVAAEERAHACHTCPVRKQHRHYRRERGRLLAGRQEAVDYLEGRRAYEDTRLQALLDGLVAVLRRFYYLTREGEKTAKAARLMDIFDTNALMISELIEGGYLETLTGPDVAEVFSWFAYDRDIEFRNRNLLPGHLVHLRRQMDELQRDIFGAERRHDLMITTGYNPYFYGVVRSWCRGASMAGLLAKVELSEGDIVMAMTKTLDVMRQVREMLLRHNPDNALYVALREAEGLLRRGVVEMVNSIGFVRSGPESPAPGAAASETPAASAKSASSGFADVDRMLGILADPNSTPPPIHPPDTELQRPDRPARFPRPERDGESARPPQHRTGHPGGGRDRGARPPASGGRDRDARSPYSGGTHPKNRTRPGRDTRPGHRPRRGGG
jgi:ATP-dependent RNA helicase HelY